MQVGIEIGGTKLQIATGDAQSGKLQQVYRYQVDRDQGAVGILQRIEDTLLELPSAPSAIGVGFGGPVNYRIGLIATSHQIGGWSGFDLKTWLQARFDVPIFIDNDANVAALGEACFGAGRGLEQVFYITLGSGVGGGLVLKGEIYHGNFPGEVEVGHLRLNREGDTLESQCSGWALDAQIRDALPALPQDSILKQLATGQSRGEARFLLPAWQQRDPAALELLQRYATTLAWGLSHVTHLFNPQLIVLGGGVALIGEPLREAIEQALPAYLVPALQPGPQLSLAALGEEAVLVGALCLLPQF
jgi:glucokinase